MRKSVHIIYNPVAHGVRQGLIVEAAEKLETLGMTVAMEATEGPGTAGAMARRASADVLVAAGGDGTIREAIDGLAGTDRALAIFPLGTANVLAAEMGLTSNVDDVVNTISRGVARPLNLGLVNGRHFAVMASVGFDADVVAEVNLKLKRRIGKGAYILAAMQKMLSFEPQRFTINVDGVDHQCGGAIIMNGRYYGGKFVCVPMASVTDAHLHACVLRSSSRVDLLNYAAALVLGLASRCPGVEIIEGRQFRVEGPEAAVQADGDIVGHTPITIISQDPKGLSLVMPA